MNDNPQSDTLAADLLRIKERAENAARAAEEASSKANSESGFAYNAKQNAEDHARAIAQVRGTVDADFTWLTTTKKNAEDLSQAVAAAKTSAEADARATSEHKSTSEKDAAAIRAAAENVTTSLAAVAKAQADATTALTDVTNGAASVAVTKASAEANAAAIQTLQSQLAELASKAKADGQAITENEVNARSLISSINEIVAKVKETQQKVSQYETELARLTESHQALHVKIEGLLPNATSAGLASAFRNQKARFSKPQRNWLITFVVAICLLLAAGLVGLPGFWPNSGAETWDAIFRHFVTRLPLVAPLVWLAIYAGRHYMLALRVEEEYAFKEAVSTAFEGYKREMAGISTVGDSTHPPLVTLCENVLRALAQRPGRIYEGRQDDITPLPPVAKVIGDVTQTITNGKKST